MDFPAYGNNGEQLQENLSISLLKKIDYGIMAETKIGFFTTLRDFKEIKVVGHYSLDYELAHSKPINVTASHQFALASPLHCRVAIDRNVFVLQSKPNLGNRIF